MCDVYFFTGPVSNFKPLNRQPVSASALVAVGSSNTRRPKLEIDLQSIKWAFIHFRAPRSPKTKCHLLCLFFFFSSFHTGRKKKKEGKKFAC